MKHPVLVIAALVAVAGTATLALSQEAEEPLRPEVDVDALIRRLGSEDFATRQAAEKQLLALGEEALPALAKAAKSHPDEHVRLVAERLLEQIPRSEAKPESPLREKGEGEAADDHVSRMRQRLEDLLRRMEERGFLSPEDMARLLDRLAKGEPGAVLPFGGGSGSVHGVVESDGERIEYRTDESGRVHVKITRDGETEEYEAESLEALKEQAPEVHDKVARHFGRTRIFIGPRELPDWPEDFPFRGWRDWQERLRNPLTPRPLVPRERAVPEGFRLGVWIGEISDALRTHLQLREGEGVLVQDVVPGSLADRIGVEKHDVIRKLNGEPVGSAAAITQRIGKLPEGGKVTLTIIRKGAPLTLHGTR